MESRKVFDSQSVPLLWPVVAFVIGLTVSRSDLFEIPVAMAALLLLISILLVIKRYLLLLLLTTGALIGAMNLLLDARDMVVDQSWLEKPALITATVSEVQKQRRFTRLLLTDISRDDGDTLHGKALLYLYGKKQTDVVAGKQIRALVNWRLPRNFLNPGSFDYRGWCFDRQIAVIGSAKSRMEIINDHVPWLQSQREKIKQVIDSVSERESGVLEALLLGKRSRIAADVNDLFSASGTAHLLAISGMHVGMVAAWGFMLVWWLLTRFEAWIVMMPVRKLALACGLLAALTYASLAGFPIPAIRATIMLAAGVLAWQWAYRYEPVNVLLAALALILLFDPSAIVSLSLWLSFSATAALLIWAGSGSFEDENSRFERLFAAMKSLLIVSTIAALVTLPIVVATFGRIPVYSLPANMVMVPLYGLLVLPLALLGEIAALLGWSAAANMLMSFSATSISWGIDYLGLLSNFPAANLWATKPHWLSGALYLILLIWVGKFLLQRRLKPMFLALSALMACYLAFVLHESDIRQVNWVIWDVGQGASSTLLLPEKQVIVIDVPGREGSRFNGGTTVATELRHLGLTHVDLLILSHAQSDHLGGALSLMSQVNHVGEIWLPDVPSARDHHMVQKIIDKAEIRGIAIHWLARGDALPLRSGAADLQGRVLWPSRGFDPANHNNTSLVLDLQLYGKRLFFAGDIERQVEAELVRSGLDKVDMMLMPHHGSRSSNSNSFVQLLHPSLVFAQIGFDNHYGFPSAEVVARYHEVGAEVRNSAEGAVTVQWLNSVDDMAISQWQKPADSRRQMALSWWNSHLGQAVEK